MTEEDLYDESDDAPARAAEMIEDFKAGRLSSRPEDPQLRKMQRAWRRNIARHPLPAPPPPAPSGPPPGGK